MVGFDWIWLDLIGFDWIWLELCRNRYTSAASWCIHLRSTTSEPRRVNSPCQWAEPKEVRALKFDLNHENMMISMRIWIEEPAKRERVGMVVFIEMWCTRWQQQQQQQQWGLRDSSAGRRDSQVLPAPPSAGWRSREHLQRPVPHVRRDGSHAPLQPAPTRSRLPRYAPSFSIIRLLYHILTCHPIHHPPHPPPTAAPSCYYFILLFNTTYTTT